MHIIHTHIYVIIDNISMMYTIYLYGIYMICIVCILYHIYIYVYIYSTTEERHRSVRKHWSSYYHFIGLKCNYYALYLCFVYKKSNTRKLAYVALSHIMIHIYIYIVFFSIDVHS